MAKQRDYHAEYVARQERAERLGFSSDSERTAARRYAREEYGDDSISSADLDALALVTATYQPGDYGTHGEGFDALKALWIDIHGYDEDWEPDDDFYDWLDDLSGEPA